MTREENVGERECEEERWRKRRESVFVGNGYKRAGPSTPPPTWRLELSPPQPRTSKEFLTIPAAAAEVSSRKLCADLYGLEQFRPLILGRGLWRDKVEEGENDGHLNDHQPTSTGSLRRQNSGPNERLVQRYGHANAMQSVSPASSSNSLEVAAACKRAFTSTDSLELKTPSYSLRSSRKLLNVLNRIWSLEEQHVANTSLVKALKSELDQCRDEVKELQRQKHMDRQGAKELQENHKLVRRRAEQEQFKAAIQSVREELKDERKIRRRSDSLQRKLGQELCEMKHSFARALKELEREKRVRVLKENLCDEFAEAVKGHEDDERANGDRLIVHIAEAWIHERSQMKFEEDKGDSLMKNSVADRLGLDIETFLRVKRTHVTKKEKTSSSLLRSLQSNRSNGFEKRRSGESKSARSLDLDKSCSRRQESCGDLREKSADSDPSKQRVRSRKLEKDSSNSRNAPFPQKGTRREDQLQLLRETRFTLSENVTSHPEISTPKGIEHCSKQPRNLEEETVQAKLMEARTERRRSRSRATVCSSLLHNS